MSKDTSEEVEKNQLIILKDFFQNNDVLFFYSNKKELTKVFGAVLDPWLNIQGNQAIYAYPRDVDKIKRIEHLEGKRNFTHLPILDRKYKKLLLDDIDGFEKRLLKLIKAEDKEAHLKVLIDFENTISEENLGRIIKLKEKLEKKLSGGRGNQIFTIDIRSINKNVLEQLINLCEKFVISSDKDYILLSTFHPGEMGEIPEIGVLSRKDLEERVKKSVDYIVYSILQSSAYCGFDIIKNIILHFNVFLSQGTVYPILYDLTEKGYLKVQMKSDNKTRLYSVTEDGKTYFKSKIRNYVDAQERVTEFIRSQMEGIVNE